MVSAFKNISDLSYTARFHNVGLIYMPTSVVHHQLFIVSYAKVIYKMINFNIRYILTHHSLDGICSILSVVSLIIIYIYIQTRVHVMMLLNTHRWRNGLESIIKLHSNYLARYLASHLSSILTIWEARLYSKPSI